MAFQFAGQFTDAALDTNGRLLISTPVNVYSPGTTSPVALYTDRTKATPAANPTSTDTVGNLTFFAAPGDYDLVAVIGGVPQARVTVTVDPDPADVLQADAQSISLSVPGPLTVFVGQARYYFEFAYTLVIVRASVGTAPSGVPANFNLRQNGLIIVQPSIAVAQFTTGPISGNGVTFAADDYVTVDCTQSGSAADLTLQLSAQ